MKSLDILSKNMQKDSRIFVAGHKGLVGSAILEELQNQGYTHLFTQTHQELDLKDMQKVGEFFQQNKIEYVFLCAAKVGGIMANNTYRADFIYENLAIQNSVIYSAYQHKIKKLLFLGSSCIYPKEANQPITENELLKGELEYTNEPYAIAKIAGLKMCESFNLQYKTNFISVMPTNLYGKNDNFDLYNSHVLPALLRKFHLAKLLQENKISQIKQDIGELDQLKEFGIYQNRIILWGSGEAKREFLHSSDMAKACIYTMQNIDFSSLCTQKEVRNTHINIGSGEEVSIKELAFLIKEIVGYQGEVLFDCSKPDGTMRKFLDSSKLQSFGWSPSITLKEGVKQVYLDYLCK